MVVSPGGCRRLRKPRRQQQPRAENFVFAERFKCGIGDRDYSQRVTQRVEHLGTVPFGAIRRDVVFHRLHDVTAFEAVFRQVPGQHHIVVGFELQSAVEPRSKRQNHVGTES